MTSKKPSSITSWNASSLTAPTVQSSWGTYAARTSVAYPWATSITWTSPIWLTRHEGFPPHKRQGIYKCNWTPDFALESCTVSSDYEDSDEEMFDDGYQSFRLMMRITMNNISCWLMTFDAVGVDDDESLKNWAPAGYYSLDCAGAINRKLDSE